MLNENPLKLNVGEYTMHVPDAPSSGPVLALILNIVNGEGAERGQAGGAVLCFLVPPPNPKSKEQKKLHVFLFTHIICSGPD